MILKKLQVRIKERKKKEEEEVSVAIALDWPHVLILMHDQILLFSSL